MRGGSEPAILHLETGNDNIKFITITHNLGRKPVAIYCMKSAYSKDSYNIQWFNAFLDPKKTKLEIYLVTTNSFQHREQNDVSEFPSSGFVGKPILHTDWQCKRDYNGFQIWRNIFICRNFIFQHHSYILKYKKSLSITIISAIKMFDAD